MITPAIRIVNEIIGLRGNHILRSSKAALAHSVDGQPVFPHGEFAGQLFEITLRDMIGCFLLYRGSKAAPHDSRLVLKQAAV
jgi:hypothetical protein